MTLLLGVDCGATWSKGALFSASGGQLEILAADATGGANPNVVGATRAKETLSELIRSLVVGAGVSGSAVAAATLGGADAAMLEAAARPELPSATITATSDVVLPAFASPGRQTAPVVAVVAGTGSMAVRLEPGAQQHTAQAGGWGWFLGDESGGVDIGRRVVRAVLDEIEGGNATRLTPLVTAAIGSQAAGSRLRGDIYQYVYGQLAPQTAVSRLSPLLTAAHEGGDPVAGRIMRETAEHLRDIASRVYRPGDWIVAAGSVACGLREHLEPALLGLVGDASRLTFTADGVAGAVIAAGESVGSAVPADLCSELWAQARTERQLSGIRSTSIEGAL